MSTKIFVGNLVEDADENALRSKFAEYGEVGECVVFHKYGFVHMANESDARRAINDLHQSMFQGQHMNVELSKSKPKREGSNYGKTSGDRGSRGGGGGGRGRDGGGPMRGRGGGRSGPYSRDSDGGYSRDRDYPMPPPPDYYRRGGYDFGREDRDIDPRSYWPPPEVYFRWFYDTYYPRESSRDPLDRPPPEYYRRDRSRDFPPYGGSEDRDRGYPFSRPGDKGYGGKDGSSMGNGGYLGAGMGGGNKSYSAYTTTNSSAYTGANYSNFGK